MNYKTIIIFLSVLLIYRTTAFSQNPTSLQGSAISETDEKIEFYTLVLQSTVDSSVVAVEMFSDTAFRFSGIKPQTYILRILDVQYQPYDTLITVAEGTNVLKTPLVLKPKTLGEVVVKSSHPVLTYNHGNITVDVANSYLKDDVSLASILGKLPGLIVDREGKVSMFGKSHLQIYINDMQARSGDEFKALQPDNIDKIEIIRNVGAEYDANVDAVIRIKTKKRREEKFHISISDEFRSSSYVSNESYLSLYFGGNEKLSQYITLGAGFDKGEQQYISSLYTYFDDYTHLNARNSTLTGKSGSTKLFYSINYSISKNRELGVQYNGRFRNPFLQHYDFTQTYGTRFYDDETTSQTVDVNSEEKYNPNQSNINLNYKQKINNTGELSVIADYVIRNVNRKSDIKETSGDWSANNIIDADQENRVFSITPEYKITGKKFTYIAGVKYSHLNNKSTTEFRPSTNVDRTRLSEYTTGAYMVFGADLSFLNIKSGLRMEYTNSDILSDDGLNDLRRDYLNFVPHISLTGKPNKHLNLTVHYTQRLNRPHISYISSTMYYYDSLSYSTGNPRLKTATIDMFGFTAMIYKFNFSLGYNIHRDKIIPVYTSDNTNPNRTISTYSNMKERYEALTLGISYSFKYSVFTNMTSINYSKQLNLNMLFRNEIIRFNKPMYSFQTSGNVKIFKNTSLDYSFYYSAGGNRDYMRWQPNNSLNFKVAQYLMDKKLTISVMVNDIFNKSRRNSWTEYRSNYFFYTQDEYLNQRTVGFHIRYNWGIQKSIQQKRSDTDHINRL
jgi:hypothetical protein